MNTKDRFDTVPLRFQKEELVHLEYSYTVGGRTRSYGFDIRCTKGQRFGNGSILPFNPITLTKFAEDMNEQILNPFLEFMHTTVKFKRLTITKDVDMATSDRTPDGAVRKLTNKEGREVHTYLCSNRLIGRRLSPKVPTTALQLEILTQNSRITTKRYMFGAVPDYRDSAYYARFRMFSTEDEEGEEANKLFAQTDEIEKVYLKEIETDDFKFEMVLPKKVGGELGFETILTCKYRGIKEVAKRKPSEPRAQSKTQAKAKPKIKGKGVSSKASAKKKVKIFA
jgi:hypothetical protein